MQSNLRGVEWRDVDKARRRSIVQSKHKGIECHLITAGSQGAYVGVVLIPERGWLQPGRAMGKKGLRHHFHCFGF